MNWEIFINSNVVNNLGWTLIHSVWQIGLIATVLFLCLRIGRDISSNFRYWLAVSALCLAVTLPVFTFVQLMQNSLINISANKNQIAEQSTTAQQKLNRSENLTENIKPESNTTVSTLESLSINQLQSFFNDRFSGVLPFVVGAWMLGVLIFALRLGGGVWQLRRYRTEKISEPGEEWQNRFSVLYEKLKITQTVKFLQSNLVQTPIVLGFLKPVILIPASVFLQINPRELETIIAHELIHIRRYDALVNFAQGVIEVLFFYHPGVWWISAVIRAEREFATDAAVTEIFAESRILYANALANLEEIRLLTNQALPRLATAANGGNLMHRITKILQNKTGTRQSRSAWSAIVALALVPALLLTVFSFTRMPFVNAETKIANKKLAIGFVSIPPLDRTENPPKDADATARLLIEKLKSYKIPAIGFLQGGMISDGEKLFPVRANIARLWRDAGFEIGIGGFKHIWFYDTPFNEYVANVEKNEQIARKILAEKNLTLKYFSYPYLNTGKSADERNRFENWLKEKGITPVKYTIDNQEWMYSYAYDMARNDNDVNTMNEIRAAFIEYMTKMFDHFEKYSGEMFGRDIAQTMVLTPSRLVADSSDELFGMINKRGYQFVSMDEAQKDEAYQTAENFTGKSGISWFERWQMAKGKKLLDEPKIHTTVWNIWEKTKKK